MNTEQTIFTAIALLVLFYAVYRLGYYHGFCSGIEKAEEIYKGHDNP